MGHVETSFPCQDCVCREMKVFKLTRSKFVSGVALNQLSDHCTLVFTIFLVASPAQHFV